MSIISRQFSYQYRWHLSIIRKNKMAELQFCEGRGGSRITVITYKLTRYPQIARKTTLTDIIKEYRNYIRILLKIGTYLYNIDL